MNVLESALTASNTSEVFHLPRASRVWVEIEGTFGGGSVAMQQSNDNSSWSAFTADGSAVSWSANNMVEFELPSGYYRFVAASVTTVAIATDVARL